MYLPSADWMQRNFFNRVETCFPIEEERLRRGVIRDLELYLADSTKWELKSDGTYEQGPETGKRVAAQELLLEELPD